VREKKGRAAQSPAGTHLHASILQHLEHVLLHVALRQRKVDLHIVVRNRPCHFSEKQGAPTAAQNSKKERQTQALLRQG